MKKVLIWLRGSVLRFSSINFWC